jgi:hypothetical protein
MLNLLKHLLLTIPILLFAILVHYLIPFNQPVRQTASEESAPLPNADAAIFNYLAKRALSYYPYFTRAELIQDLELLVAINQGIDRSRGTFFYQKREYFLPALYGAEQKSFVKKGKLYDLKTGVELSWSKATFLKYLKNDYSNSLSAGEIYKHYSPERKSLILHTIAIDEEAYQFLGDVYTISGVKIENSSETLSLTESLRNFGITSNAIKIAIASKRKYIFAPNGKIIHLKTKKVLTDVDLNKAFASFAKKLISPVDIIKYPPVEAHKIALSVLNSQRLISSLFHWKDYNLRANNRDLYHYDERKNYCPIKLILANQNSPNQIVDEFLSTLEKEKIKLMKFLKLTNDEYNELAQLAFGILGAESDFGENRKYVMKEKINIGSWNMGQSLIKLLKSVKGRDDNNSRGLTQIKDATSLFLNSPYGEITDNDLNKPDVAAIATIIVLEEKYRYLMRQKSKHPNIDEDNWIDYLDYYYTGSAKEILRGTATPVYNLRLNHFKQWQRDLYLMEKCP